MRLPDPEPHTRILFISPNRVGDSVIASGLVREMGRRWPGAGVTIVTSPVTAPFFRSAPGIVRIIPMQKGKGSRHWRQLWRQVVGTRWDVVIDTRSSPIAWLVRAGERRVYNRGWEDSSPKVEVISRVIGSDVPLEPELFIDDRARAEAAAVIDPQLVTGSGPGPLIALAPIAVQPGKSWPRDRWGLLVERLKAEPRFDGWRFMLVGGPGDEPHAAPSLAAAGARGIDFVGKGDILASAAAIARSALFVGNDSGLMHTAAAAGTPTLGLFGPTQWWLYGPRGPRTATVAANPVQGQYAPIEDLTVDQVFAAVLALVDAYPAGRT